MKSESDSPKPSTYVEVMVTVYRSWPHKDFAFGTAVINGVETDVHIGSRGHSIKTENGFWLQREALVPEPGDILLAKVYTVARFGKNIGAAFWRVELPATNGNGHYDGRYDE